MRCGILRLHYGNAAKGLDLKSEGFQILADIPLQHTNTSIEPSTSLLLANNNSIVQVHQAAKTNTIAIAV